MKSIPLSIPDIVSPCLPDSKLRLAGIPTNRNKLLGTDYPFQPFNPETLLSDTDSEI